ncbi:hypothetical protein PHSY_001814 [Pseudozyma hubeiensis SY62]|uniref:Flavin reductase like domain-containing protein n=1 Tax=Pseudozyma hubeiensis (strain SY62) TaxID=1305764 RepID=R9NZG0_PSEHS|nr:hypothetical protein PHSY_001814 [Pseudozyma hubeiensis SY62]GAC94243.1 hypothetical protein PHSY_001814 [Pseudozyma hubeiensis SY62]
MATSARATTSKVTLEAFSPSIARGVRRPIRCKPSQRNSFFHGTSARHTSKAPTQSSHEISSSIRSLMRESAQPVALVTTLLPPTNTQIHAATLSSFTSISLEPNLVCFSIKTPSKLADALAWHVSQRRGGGGGVEVDFVINVLSSSQAGLAAAYARPGTPPLELSEAAEQDGGQAHPLRCAGIDGVPCGRGETVTVVQGSIGSLACSVVESVDLDQYGSSEGEVDAQEMEGECKTSKLYIARVVHVHSPGTNGDDTKGQERVPLVYHRQKFVCTTETALIES